MHQIEAAGRQIGAVDIPLHELDVVLAARPYALARMLEEDGIHIETDDLPRCANALAEQIRDAFGPAAQIKAAPSLPDTDLLQHDRRVRCKRRALDMQPLDLAGAPLDRIVTVWRFSHRDWGLSFGAGSLGQRTSLRER